MVSDLPIYDGSPYDGAPSKHIPFSTFAGLMGFDAWKEAAGKSCRLCGSIGHPEGHKVEVEGLVGSLDVYVEGPVCRQCATMVAAGWVSPEDLGWDPEGFRMVPRA